MTTRPEDDDRLDAALARALAPVAEDTAPLSQAVLSRLAERPAAPRRPLGAVLADPRPLAAAMLVALLLAGSAGYALLPASVEEAALLLLLVPGV